MKKLIIAAVIFLYFFNLNLNLSLNGDNASYIMFSKGIASGEGMVFTNYPVPVQSGYKTFTLPVLLSYFIRFNIDCRYFKFIVLALTLLFLGLMRVKIKPAAAVLLIALNPLVLDYSWQILTENIYLFFSFAVLFFLKKQEKITFLNFILLTFSFYFLRHLKEIGITIPLAALIYYGIKKQYRNFLLILLALIIIFSFNHIMFEPSSNIYSSLTAMKNQYLPHEGVMTFKDTALRPVNNFFQYVFKALPDAFFYPVFHYIKPRTGDSFNVLFSLKIITGLFLLWFISIGFFLSLKRMSIFTVYFLVYFFILVMWQSALHRYLLPVIPILIIYFYDGLIMLNCKKILKTVVIITFLCFTMTAFLNRFYLMPLDWQEYFEAGRIVNSFPDEKKVALTRKPGLLHLKNGYYTAPYPLSLNADDHYNEIKKWGCNFIIIDNLTIGVNSAQMYLVPAIEELKRRELIKIKDKVTIGRTSVLRIEI